MSLRRLCNTCVAIRGIRFQNAFAKKLYSTSAESKDEIVDITSADEKPVYSHLDDAELQKEIARKRNKSRLNTEHRNILMGLRPYDESHEWYHNTLRYKRRMLGRYGLAAVDVPAGFAWPTIEELKDAREYEKVAFPLSLQERWTKLREEHQRKAAAAEEREAEIAEKLAKMNQWTAELNARIAKKAADLEAARLRKERLVEEVRRHFGFKISPSDERFKEMLAQKEKEEKKKKKEAKKKARLEKLTSIYQDQPKDANLTEQTDSTKLVE